jgi:hypothetical protein
MSLLFHCSASQHLALVDCKLVLPRQQFIDNIVFW